MAFSGKGFPLDVQPDDLTFDNLRYQYGTGRAYTISGAGRNRVTGYRTGVQTKLGDIEISNWMALMQELIEKSGEQALHAALIEWLSEHNYRKAGKSEIAREAMELHSSRIFDNEEWVDFLPFNRRYRPEVLSGVETVDVFTDCCQQWGTVTRRRLEWDRSVYGKRVSCPVCGRLSEYQSEQPDGLSLPMEDNVDPLPTTEEIGLATMAVLKRVRKIMLGYDLKYHLSDFSYAGMGGEVCNQGAANSVRWAAYYQKGKVIQVDLTCKCKRNGRKLRFLMKENAGLLDEAGAQVGGNGVTFIFSLGELLREGCSASQSVGCLT